MIALISTQGTAGSGRSGLMIPSSGYRFARACGCPPPGDPHHDFVRRDFKSGGTVPPAAGFSITSVCSQMFMAAELPQARVTPLRDRKSHS